MTDRDSFIRAICEQSDDDVRRLAFADWLDEHGEPERAEFIRIQIWHSQNWPAHAFKKGCRCDSCKAFRRAGMLCKDRQQEWAGAAWSPSYRINFYRGFVETIWIRLQLFENSAAAIFAEQPVTIVHLIDACPAQSHSSQLWGWCKPERPHYQSSSGICAEMWELMPGGRVSVEKGGEYEHTWRDYDTPEEAKTAIGVAAVAVGRKWAKLTPRTPPVVDVANATAYDILGGVAANPSPSQRT